MSKGRSIKLFLVDGSPNGILTAEIMNWTGHILTGPRTRIAEIINRHEAKGRAGVYFLVGPDPDDPLRPLVYIGESDNIASRLKQHSSPEEGGRGGKDFWELVCLVTSKDQNLTKGHIKHLEAELIRIANSSGGCTLTNQNAAEYGQLPESDLADMSFFVKQISMVLPVLGFDFLRDKTKLFAQLDASKQSNLDAPTFVMRVPRHDVTARAKEVDGEFVVLAGSIARGHWSSQSEHASYERLYKELRDNGILIADKDGLAKFSQDYAFSSPSAAGAVVAGRTSNGRIEWLVEGSNMKYGEWQTAQIEKQTYDIKSDE